MNLVIYRDTVDRIASKIAKGNIQSELDLLFEGFTRTQIGELRSLISNRISVGSVGGILVEIEGIPVWGEAGWYMYGAFQDWNKVEDERFRTGPITGDRKKLLDLSSRISVHAYDSISFRYLELSELKAQISAAKELLASEDLKV